MVDSMEKLQSIIFLWFAAFATILFILTLKYQNYDMNSKATIAALLTSPFAFAALYNIQKN